MNRKLRPLAALGVLALIAAGCSDGSAGSGSSKSSAGIGNSTAVAHAKAVKFAECMRSHDVAGFPDPDASGQLTIDAVANGSSVNTSSAAFEQAMSACKRLEPPGFTGGKVTPHLRTVRLEFAQCIRDHGVKDFPDPADDQPLVDTRRIPSTNEPGGLTLLNAAMHTCGAIYAGKLGLKGR
jgi:hypothetical protein